MTITLSQHYDITWLIALLLLGSFLVGGDWLHNRVVESRSNKARKQREKLTRYSFINPKEKA